MLDATDLERIRNIVREEISAMGTKSEKSQSESVKSSKKKVESDSKEVK